MNTALIITIGFLGALLIAAFTAITLFVPATDRTIAYVGLAGVAALFIPQLLTFKSSSDNAAKLQEVDRKVDGHLSGLTKELKALTEKVASLELDKAVTRVETAQIIAAVVATQPPPQTGDQH